MRVLCVYATRQVDSNLLMSSTVFDGLHKSGYTVDMLFWGYPSVYKVFMQRYSKCFRTVIYQKVKESKLRQLCHRNHWSRLLYSFYRSFLVDYLIRPYRIKNLCGKLRDEYDVVLSFIPPAVSGYLAKDIHRAFCKSARLIQFWTDPLSLGGCNYVSDIPKSRILHFTIEKELLSYADKIVFCYPLLYEMEKELHPDHASKMIWSDVGYMEHSPMNEEKKTNSIIKIGLFGAFPTAVRNISPLLSVIPDFPYVQFIIRGDSDLSQASINYPNLDLVTKRIPVEEVEKLENECDILLILGNKGGIQIPGKIFYYANYPKPLICICDSVHARALKEYLGPLNRYILCDNTSSSIKEAISEAISELSSFSLIIPDRLKPETVAQRIVS